MTKSRKASLNKFTLVLASQSPARKRNLKRLAPAFGFESFLVRPAHLDEDSVAQKITDPKRLVRTLARMKAREVARRLNQDNLIVIGSDQLLFCDGQRLGKPGTSAKACKQLQFTSGKVAKLLTGVCLVGPGFVETRLQTTTLVFRDLDKLEIQAYVNFDRPENCAGSFKFEGRGISLFDKVTTDDPSAIEGLPLLQLSKMLRRMLADLSFIG